MKSWLVKYAAEMCTTYNEGKPVIAGRFIRTLKNRIYKYMNAMSRNVYIEKISEIVHKFNNTYLRASKMKPVGVKSSAYIDILKKLMVKILNLKLVILLEYQNIKTFFEKAMFQIGLKKIL